MVVSHLFTDRYGGASAPPYRSFNLGAHVGDAPEAVAENRLRLARTLDLPLNRLVFMAQVHGRDVAVITDTGDETTAPPGSVDAMVTATPDTALVVLVADCVPILFSDNGSEVIGAAHAGRLGAASGIATATVGAMGDLGATVDNITAWLGPAICGRCYEVPADMRDAVEAVLPGSASETSWGTPALDLRAGLARQLRDCGVPDVQQDSRCTRTDPGFFSHRRGAPTGRQAGVIWFR